MRKQNLVKQTLTENLETVRKIIARPASKHRTGIARALCNEFGLVDARGNDQVSSCLKVLRQLESKEQLTLPAARGHSKVKSPRRLEEAVPFPEEFPERVDSLDHLELILVRNEEQIRRWNEVVIREHPQGERPLVGRQLRYLVECEHGTIGALGFSSAALRLKDRDNWIGWNEEQRRGYLDRVVCMSRFLIRPQIQCLNLASKVLGMSIASMPVDFEAQYGYSPWLLESFVDTSQYTGTSYRAANWLMVGQTSGRGRQDQKNEFQETIKDIYVYVLDSTFRSRLGVEQKDRHAPLEVAEGLCGDEWAKNEFEGAPLGDKRLTRRLITIAQRKGESPQASFLHVVKGESSSTSGFYRFVDQPEQSHVSMDNILQPHQERTLRRMNSHKQVLCIHDTTDLNYDSLNKCSGLGIIGKNQTATSQGLSLHTSLVVTQEEGLPLGILNAHCYASQLKPQRRNKDHRYIPVEEKDTLRWLTALDQCRLQTRQLPETRVMHVMDREADFFELFHCWRHGRRDELLVRAKNNRRTNEGPLLFDLVSGSKVKHTVQVEIPRKSARTKKAGQKASPQRPKRTATLSMRYMPVAIKPPKHGVSSAKGDVNVWILHVKEEAPLPGVTDPIEWFLITSVALHDSEEAVNIMKAYSRRWRIEEWHRVLKSGCRVESPAHNDAERLERIIAINMVIAWRILLMTLLGREMPELPPELMFTDLELRVLKSFSKTQPRLPAPTTLGNAVLLTAKLGGYLARKSDPPPGTQVLWRGITDLAKMVQGALLLQIE